MFLHFRSCFRIVGILALFAPMAEAEEPLRSRRAFVQAMNMLEEGKSEADVIALVGKPDDVRTHEDHDGIGTIGTLEIWRYGTSGHLTVATLGEITIDDNHKVQYVSGQGEPPDEALFEEAELRTLIDALGRVSFTRNAVIYNPRSVILAVNLLQPLGKEKALAAIEEFLRIQGDFAEIESGNAVIFVMRTLFEVPAEPGHMPPMGLWGMPETLAEKKLLPRYPIVIEGDIPFVIGHEVALGGVPPDPADYVAYFRRHGKLRAKPLVPTDKPFAALDVFARSPRLYYNKDDRRDAFERNHLANQIFALLNTVYQVELDDCGDPPFRDDLKDQDQRIAEALKLAIRWDPRSNCYTFLDGTFLPEPNPNKYRRHIWKVSEAGPRAQFIIERRSRHFVNVTLKKFFADDVQLLYMKTRMQMPGFKERLGGVLTATIRLDEGEEIQAEVQIGKEIHRSPVIKP